MDSQRYLKTQMLSNWSNDPAFLVNWANSQRGKELEFYDSMYLTDMLHFQIIPSPATEGEGYYIVVLYKVEFIAG